MDHLRPFNAIRYARRADLDLSRVIAPPYDVLDEKQKAALQARHPNNIVTIDLPFMPPKSVGPDHVYDEANITLHAWLRAGILHRDTRAGFYPYTQSYDYAGHTFHRRGFFALVRLSPFGEGFVVPHERTYPGPIEDRLKLMRATQAQLSPIFGLFNDTRNEINNLLYAKLGKPEQSATLDNVKNDLWTIHDAETENAVIELMSTRPIYIADGHHRYTTALAYQKELELRNGGPLAPSHPANWCLFSLVGMQDPGLLILPTHRLIGGLSNFSIEAFAAKTKGMVDITTSSFTADQIPAFADDHLKKQPIHTFGLFDGKTRKLYELRLSKPDVLAQFEPSHSQAWQRLDVAILQRYLIEEILQPHFAAGKEAMKGYTADPATIAPAVDGARYQAALLLQPTPLLALEDLGQHKEVMPQKSTYFFPKLATGMVINPLA